MRRKIFCCLLFLIAIIIACPTDYARGVNQSDPLSSWNDGPIKNALIEFVRITTDQKNPQYVSPEKRIATFDQDGTTWVEQPMYTQGFFAFDQVVALSEKHPEWKRIEPFKSVLAHDKLAMEKFSKKDIEKIVLATHTGMTVDAFRETVKQWLARAKHPRWNRPYTDLVYQPMLELMQYLRANGYKIYIVTGGGQEFVRAYAQQIYGIPPSQIIGSALKTQYQYNTQKQGLLLKTPQFLLDDNYSGKPENIYLFIGQRPYAAFGNSTGDQQMLEYTQSVKPHLVMLIHHDDAKREYRYGAGSKIGTFSDALMNEAKKNNWFIVSMKNDWKYIFKFEEHKKDHYVKD